MRTHRDRFSTRRARARATAVIAGFGLGLAVAAAPAAALTLDAIDAGFVTSAGGSAKGDGTITPPATYNYSVGWELHYVDGSLGMPPGTTPLAPMERKNYFVFDLAGISTMIASATFVVNAGTYESSDPDELLVLHSPGDPGAAIADTEFLLAEHAVGPSAFDEPSDPAVGVAGALFGTATAGMVIGSALVTAADDDMDLLIALDPAYLNGFLGGKLVFGGELSTLTAAGTPEAIMGFTGPDIPGGDPLTPKLELTFVPEPGTALLVGGGLALIGVRRRTRRA